MTSRDWLKNGYGDGPACPSRVLGHVGYLREHDFVPDQVACGLKTRGYAETLASLQNILAATRAVRERLRLSAG